jgi:ParB family transcriptional regulator, chromosome partitioning protein
MARKLDRLKAEVGANAEESSGGPARAPASRATPPASKSTLPAKMRGVERSKDAALIAVDRIVPDPEQPRKEFDAEDLERMAESLKKDGQLQPIRVRWVEAESVYHIITGERRWRGARMAGIAHLACVIDDRKLSPAELLKMQMIENVVRADLKPIEQAHAMKALMDAQGWNGHQLAAELHIAQPSVVRALSLLELPPSIREKVEREELSPGSAYEISKVAEPTVQEAIAERVVHEKLTRDQTRDEVAKVTARRPKPSPRKGGVLKLGLETSRVFNHAGIKILAESRKGFAPNDLAEALGNALSKVQSEIESIDSIGL